MLKTRVLVTIFNSRDSTFDRVWSCTPWDHLEHITAACSLPTYLEWLPESMIDFVERNSAAGMFMFLATHAAATAAAVPVGCAVAIYRALGANKKI